jgi:predicted nucleic acid-binding protein
MPVEARAAFARLVREEAMTPTERAQALARLDVLRRSCGEIQPTEELRALAEGLPDQFRMRAADALQLAAALVYSGQRPRKCAFVCFDTRLARAAEELGFAVLPRPD